MPEASILKARTNKIDSLNIQQVKNFFSFLVAVNIIDAKLVA